MQQPGLMNRIILRMKRSNSPAVRILKRIYAFIAWPSVIQLPRLVLAPLRLLYELHWMVISAFNSFITFFYRAPLFQARCASFGRNVRMWGKMPFVTGHVEIHVGDWVSFGGNVQVMSGRVYDQPKLIIGDRSGIGGNTMISVNREVIIEEDVWLPYDCHISDTDAHPREADLRLAMQPPNPKDCRPVRICKKAWIGNGTHIMKGVTIGEGAIIGAKSVVITNIPAYSLAMGNPAEVIIRNFGLPSTAKQPPQKQRDVKTEPEPKEQPAG
jgi:acetyltransferase-like isoleucine patch superfamily enzyme